MGSIRGCGFTEEAESMIFIGWSFECTGLLDAQDWSRHRTGAAANYSRQGEIFLKTEVDEVGTRCYWGATS
jgi:hypothetical protein